ncbi:MAG: rod shape-determining protein [Blautia sp.]
MLRRVYGVDLGTSSVKIYSLSKNKEYMEKNMVAIRNGRPIIAVGNDAYEMYEKTPKNIQVNCPIQNGKIANISTMEVGLYSMLRRIENHSPFGSVIYFTVPVDATAVEKRAYYTVANGSMLQNNKVLMVESPLADALGLGISPVDSKGSMIVNIGARSTELSVIAGGKIIISKSFQMGGRQMDEAIVAEIRKEYQLYLGNRTAQRLKVAVGRLNTQGKEVRKVVGIDSVSGLPREEVVTSNVVNKGISACVDEIGREIKLFLERIPPQIAYQIAQEGIYLTGGSTRLPFIESYLSAYAGYSFRLSDLYEMSTIRGLEKMIQDSDQQQWASPIRQRKL